MKNSTALVVILSNCQQVLNIFLTDLLNIRFDDFKYFVAMKYRWICKCL